jgi:uncharacterized protein YuzE
MTVELGGVVFDRVVYDRESDVLYLHVGDPATAVDWEESPEGHHLRYGAAGELVGITIVDARRLLKEPGIIVVTLQDRRIDAGDLRDVLAAA